MQEALRELENQVPGEQFAVPGSGAVTVSDGDDDGVRSTGSHSQASSSTEKGQGKGKRSCQTKYATPGDTWVTHKDLSNVVQDAAVSALPAATSTTTHDLARLTAAATLAAPSAAAVLASTSTSNLESTARAAAAAASAASSSQSAIISNLDAALVTTVFRLALLAPYHGVATRDATSTVSHPCPGSFTNTFIVVAASHIQDTSDTTQLPGPDPSSLYTSKELNIPPVHRASPRSGTTTSNDTDWDDMRHF
ncbi:uncharacterized protein [Palaemon carinicauda]|uniref:uncharacterized protein n=1 Tax=Palaemon carinicauda TaxID=392227 RepID=UPI0035B59FBA